MSTATSTDVDLLNRAATKLREHAGRLPEPVALALADWLDDVARTVKHSIRAGVPFPRPEWPAFTVAREILREES